MGGTISTIANTTTGTGATEVTDNKTSESDLPQLPQPCSSWTTIVSQIQSENLYLKECIKILAAEVDLLRQALQKATGVGALNIKSEYFLKVHPADDEYVKRIKTSLSHLDADGGKSISSNNTCGVSSISPKKKQFVQLDASEAAVTSADRAAATMNSSLSSFLVNGESSESDSEFMECGGDGGKGNESESEGQVDDGTTSSTETEKEQMNNITDESLSFEPAEPQILDIVSLTTEGDEGLAVAAVCLPIPLKIEDDHPVGGEDEWQNMEMEMDEEHHNNNNNNNNNNNMMNFDEGDEEEEEQQLPTAGFMGLIQEEDQEEDPLSMVAPAETDADLAADDMLDPNFDPQIIQVVSLATEYAQMQDSMNSEVVHVAVTTQQQNSGRPRGRPRESSSAVGKIKQRRLCQQRTSSGNPLICRFCSKTFTDEIQRKSHEVKHVEPKPYRCRHCPKSFASSFRRREHERVHTGEKPFACSHCDKLFRSSTQCRGHQRVHTGEKPYACRHGQCEQTFTQSSNRNKHERRVHTGEKPYTCPFCTERFLLNRELVKHQREAHFNNQRAYVCHLCPRTFNRSGQLSRRHLGCTHYFTEN